MRGHRLIALALATVGPLRVDAQVVAPPSASDLIRWSNDCLHVAPAAWPTIDALHDQLIADLRALPNERDDSITKQSELESAFFDDVRAVVDPSAASCFDGIRLEREEAHLRAVLEARHVRIRVPSVTDVFGGLAPNRPEAREAIVAARRATIEALRRVIAPMKYEPMPTRESLSTLQAFQNGKPLTPAERSGVVAQRAALDALVGEVPAPDLEAARVRWQRGLVARPKRDSDRVAVILRNLRTDSAEERAKAAALADEIEKASFDRLRTIARELLDERTEDFTRESPYSVDKSMWPRIAALREGERGKDLSEFCHFGESIVGYSSMLRELVTEEGIARLAPLIMLVGNDRKGTSMEERLAARDAWEASIDAPASALAPTEDELNRLRALIGPKSPDEIVAFDQAIAACREAYATRVTKAFERRSEANRLADSGKPSLTLHADCIGETSAALRESENRLRDALLPLCRDDAARQEFALWRLDRLCRIFVGRNYIDINRSPALLCSPWSAEASNAMAARGADAVAAARATLAASGSQLETLVLEYERLSMARAQEQALDWAIGQLAAGPKNADGSVTLDEEYIKRSAALHEEAERSFPKPTRDHRDVWNAWTELRERLIASLRGALPDDAAAAIVRDWGRRSLPQLGRDPDRATIERLAREHAFDPNASDAIRRAILTADRLEDEIIKARFAARYSMDNVAMNETFQKLRALDSLLIEDRQLAVVRLQRDLGLMKSP